MSHWKASNRVPVWHQRRRENNASERGRARTTCGIKRGMAGTQEQGFSLIDGEVVSGDRYSKTDSYIDRQTDRPSFQLLTWNVCLLLCSQWEKCAFWATAERETQAKVPPYLVPHFRVPKMLIKALRPLVCFFPSLSLVLGATGYDDVLYLSIY